MLKLFKVFLLFSSIKCDFDLITKFLQNLESSERPNFIFVLKVGNFQYIDLILKTLQSPKINLENNGIINYLNLERFENTNSLKYYFNMEFLTLIFIENCSTLEVDVFARFLKDVTVALSRNQLQVLLTDDTCFKTDKILSKFYVQNFINVIVLNVKIFQKSQTFDTFEIFPSPKIVSKSKFLMENITNLKYFEVNIACNDYFPYSVCFEMDNNIEGIGRNFHIFKNFIKFINGTVVWKIEENEIADLSTQPLISTIMYDLSINPLNADMF